MHTATCTHPFMGKVVHFKALISPAVGASLHLHLAIIGGTSALYEPTPVYIPIIHNANTHTQTHSEMQHLDRSGNRRECKYTQRQSQKRTRACQHLHAFAYTHTHLKENHNGSEALSDHLTSAQHPPINRKTGSAPRGRKQHLENRLKWGVSEGGGERVSTCVVLFYILCIALRKDILVRLVGHTRMKLFLSSMHFTFCVGLQTHVWMC